MFNWFKKKKEADISEPVLTIVSLIKNDTNRFDICYDYGHRLGDSYHVVDKVNNESFKVAQKYSATTPCRYYTPNPVDFTRDECKLLWHTVDDIVCKIKQQEEYDKLSKQKKERERLKEVYCNLVEPKAPTKSTSGTGPIIF